jgi:hypothetical protein
MPSTKTPTPVAGNGNGALRRPVANSVQPLGATAKAAARNRTRIIAGVFTLVMSALVAGLLYANVGRRNPVVAIARPVAAGQVIQAADLNQVLASSVDGIRTTPWSSRSSVVGKTAAMSLVAGSLLNPGQITTGSAIDARAAVVGAVLKPGQFPTGLRPGDKVLAIILPPEAAAATGQAAVDPPIAVTLAAIEKLLDSAGSVSVSLAVPPGDAATLAVAGARGRLALVLAPR